MVNYGTHVIEVHRLYAPGEASAEGHLEWDSGPRRITHRRRPTELTRKERKVLARLWERMQKECSA